MLTIASIFIAITALLHIVFFKTESLDFMKPRVLKAFQVEPAHADSVRLWAFNQGFYNLFLALGLLYSLTLIHGGQLASGLAIARVLMLIIVGAGIVLWRSAPRLLKSALIQALPPLLGLAATFAL